MHKPKVMSEEVRKRSELFIEQFVMAVTDRATLKQFDTVLAQADVLADGLAKKCFIDASIFWKEVAYQFETHLQGGKEHRFTKRAVERVKKYEDFATGDILKKNFPYAEREDREDRENREKREAYEACLKEYATSLESRLLFSGCFPETQTWVKPKWMQAHDKIVECSGDGSHFMEHIVEDVCKAALKQNRWDVIELCAAQLVKNADAVIQNGKYPDLSLPASAWQLWDCAFNYCAVGSNGKANAIGAWERTVIVLANHDLKMAEREIEWVWCQSNGCAGAVDSEMQKMVEETQAELEPDHPSSRGFKAVFGERFRAKAGLG